jgi:ribosomal protein S18 acetylase RimI-like enzyme
MDVRPAGPGDAERVREIAEAAWWSAYAGFLSPDAIRTGIEEGFDPAFVREVLDEHDAILFVVAEPPEPEASPVGFLTASRTWADEVELLSLYVHPDRWDEGAGSALIDAAVAAAREAGVDRLRAEVFAENHAGRGFLRARGFEHRGGETVAVTVGEQTREAVVLERPVDVADEDGGADAERDG